MRMQTSILLGIASAMLGLSMALEQSVEPVVALGSGQAAAAGQESAGTFVFVLFHEGSSDPATRVLWQILEAAATKRLGQAIAVNVRVNDAAMKTVVDRYGVGRSSMPLILAVAPDGVVRGCFGLKLPEEKESDGCGDCWFGKKQQKREVCSMNEPKRRVLFVCVENSNRSQMAEAFARLHGGDQVEAHSAGSRPSGRINPRAVQFMREVGCDLSAQKSKSLDRFNGTEVDVAVTMGCGESCPLVRACRREEWNIPDPKELPDEEFRAIRDLIEHKVKELLASL